MDDIISSVECFFPCDGRTANIKRIAIVSWEVKEPDEYNNQALLNNSARITSQSTLNGNQLAPEITTKSSRSVRLPSRFRESSSDINKQQHSYSTRIPRSAETTSNVNLRISDEQQSASDSSSEDIESSDLPAPKRGVLAQKVFNYFDDVTAFNSTISKEYFCNSDLKPHDRFPPSLCDKSYGYLRPLSLLKAFFPSSFAETVIVNETSKNLASLGEELMTINEFWIYMALRLSMSLFSGEDLSDFWKTEAEFMFPAHNLSQYGISRDRFKVIAANLKFINTNDSADPLDDIRQFYEAFNMNMRSAFCPGWSICVDESMTQ